MLVDKKFIYVSLPRCASTAFYYSCLIQNLSVEHVNEDRGISNSSVDFSKVPEGDLMNFIDHGHERLTKLRKKFGYEYPIISVRRDRHERFHSLFKHVLFDLYRVREYEIYEHFRDIDIEDLFFFKSDDVSTMEKRWNTINEYLLSMDLIDKPVDISITNKIDHWKNRRFAYVVNILDILITPVSFWHNNDNDIIWFEFGKFDEMEEWIFEKTGKKFGMFNVNSSKNVECKLLLDQKFMKKYDDIYDRYDLPKLERTLI